MPEQDIIIDQIDEALKGFNVSQPAKEPVRQPAVKEPLRGQEDVFSWARSFVSSPISEPQPIPDTRVDREKAVRTFTSDVPAASGSTFGRNVSKGVLNIGETSLGFFESLTDILGASKAKSWLKEKGDRLDELNRAIPNEIESFTDVEDAGDAGAYLAMTIGQLVPQIGTALIGGTAARALTAGASAGARVLGTLAGTVVPSVIQESGGIYRGVRDETGVEAPVTSLTFGAIAGALEAVTPSRFLLKVFDTGTDEIKRKSLASLLKLSAREILKETGEAGVRVGKAAAKTGLTEFGTEIAQEGIALGANKFADGTYDLINSKNAVRLIDAGLMGLVGGAALGSVEPSIERAIKYTRQQEDQNAANERQKQTDVEKERQRIDANLQTQREDRERETALAQALETNRQRDLLPPSGTVQEVTPPVVAPIAQGPGTFAQRAAPALDNRIRELHNLLIDSNAFGASEFYDATFPIPREGGIVAARSSQKYQSDPAYAARVDASIRDITDTMVAANQQRMALMDKPSVGGFGVNYSVQKARATYGVNVIRAWHNEAKQTYPVSSTKLGNISIRESFQNSLDAVMSAIQNREIKKGVISIDVDPRQKWFRVKDNGVGMSDTDIGDKFLSLHSTGKAIQGRFGGFGIAKAVILGPSDTAKWTLRTRDNKFNNEMAETNAQVESVPFEQGTEIEVKTDDYILDYEAKQYIETTDLPKNVTVKFDGGEVKNPFKGKRPIQTTVVLSPSTSYVLSWYPKAPNNDYNRQYIIRLVDPKTGARLTQAIKPIYNSGFRGTIVVDVTTTAVPGSSDYPLLSSRMGLKHPADKPIDELIAEKSVDVLSARRQGQQSKFQIASSRSEWRDTISKIPTDESYQKLSSVIYDIWTKTGSFFGAAPVRPFTPLKELDIKIDTGFKGYHGGTMFQAKHLAAYEAVSRLMALAAQAPVTNFYGLLSKPIDGGQVNAEHATGGGMGLNFLLIDKTSLKNPVTYALYLRELIAHELTHEFFGPHNEEFTSKEIDVQRRTAHLFPEIVRIAEATLGKESELGQKTTQPKIKIVERIVERRVNVPVEVQTIVEKYLSPEQLQFIYDNAERDTPSATKDDLYYPRQGNDQELWAEPIRTSGGDIGLSGPPKNAGVGRGPQQPNPPSVPVAEQGSLGIGPIGTQSERRGSISPPPPPIPPVPKELEGFPHPPVRWVGNLPVFSGREAYQHLFRRFGAPNGLGRPDPQNPGGRSPFGAQMGVFVDDANNGKPIALFDNAINADTPVMVQPTPIPPVPSTGQSQYGTGQLLTYGSTPTIPPNTPEGLGQAVQETSETGTLIRQRELQRGAAESTTAAQTRQTTLEGALDSIADEVNALQTELNSLEPKLKFDSRTPTGIQAIAQMRYIQGRIDGLRKVHADLVSKADGLISGMPDDGGRRGAVSRETSRRLSLLDSGITKLSSQFRKSVSESTIFSVAEFKRRVAASNLSPDAKSFIDAFLNSKAAKYLEGARFRIAEALDGGWEGSYFKGLVEIAETATPGVAPQEFMHRIFDLLPESDKQAIEVLRQERLAELQAQYPNDPLLASILAGPMTTANFVAANPTDQQITDLYPVTTTDEFFAHMMSDKFVARTKGATSRGLISTIREAIKDLVAAIKKGFRLPVTADQMFRNVINGRYDVTPEGGVQSEQRRGAVVPITRVKTIERVAAFAKPGAERQTEALLATGQVTSLRNILQNNLASVPAAIIDRVGRLVGFERMDAISTYVRDVMGQSPVEYRAARAQLTDEGQKNLIAVHTNRGHELFEQNAVSVRNKWEHQQKKLASPAWAAKLRELARRRAKQDAVQSAREAVELAIKNGLDRAVTRIRESGGNDAVFESAEQEREFYEQLLSRSGEVATAMDSIARALGFTPDGVSIVFGTKGNNANDLLTFYHMMVPLPPADPVTGRNPQFAINRVAAEILSRNVTLRQRMVAAIWTEATELAKPIKDLEDQIVHDMQAGNPRTVIGKLIRQAGNLNRNEGKAAAAFLVKFREVTREVELLEALGAAVAVIDATLADPQYRAVRTEVATDARAEVRPQAAKALELAEPFYAKSHIYLPDGTIVELNMFPDKVRFDDELNQKLDPALTALNTWLFDAANIDHPSRFFYKQQYGLFHALWMSNMAVNPPKQLVAFRNTTFKVMDSMLGMLGPMLQNIGTRSTSLAQTALAVWESANHLMGDWLARWNPLIVESIGRAAKSHPAISGGQTRGNAAKEWHDKVFSPMAAREQDPARPGLRVGDVIPESGEVVTQQDLDALHLQVAATRAAHEVDVVAGRKGLAIPNLVEDRYVPGLKFFRGSLAFAKNMIMRRFDRDGIHIATAFAERKAKIAPFAPADQRRALINFWNNHFDYVKSAAIHRNAQYSNLTDFEAALETAVPEIANGGITTVKELVDFVAASSTTTEAEIEAWLFGELDRHATAITKATASRKDLGILEFAAIENQNPFTVGRGPEVAPPAWYSYGFTDSPSIYNFSMSGGNFYFEILMKSLNSVSADLGAEISRQATEEKRLAQTLGTGGAAQANLRQNQSDIRFGRQTATLEDLSDFKRGLDKLILMLNERFSPGGKRLEEEFGLGNKLLSNFTSGVLASSFTLARNALEGGFVQNGFRMSRLFGSTLQGFPRAFLGLMQTLLKVGGSGLLSLPIAAGKVLANVPAATGTFFTTGNLLKAEHSLFGTAMREIATTMYERVKMFRDLEELGLGMSAYPAEQVQASIQFPLTFGQILQEKGVATSPFPRLLQTIGPALFSWYDANLNLFIRPVFSRAGDQIANLAVANATLGGLHNLEARLRKLFSVYRDAGVPIASLSNHVFTPSEILGKWFGMERSQTNLREIQQWFHNSLIPLNESVFDYLTRLETDPKANWLTPEEKMRLIVKNVEEVNVATPSNRPIVLRKNLIMRAVGALLGWNIKAFRSAIQNFTGIAASDPKFSQTQLQIATYTLVLATLAWSALGQAGIEEILRFLGWTINRERRATRQPWEQEGLDQAKQWTVYGFNSIPFVATAVNMMFSDLPNKAGFSPTLLVQNKIIDVLNYVSGAIRTRDITYRLPQLVRGFNPLSPVVMNRLPAVAGSVEALNASRLYRRYGDLDLIRRSTGGPGVSATSTRLTPYGDRILNALAQGDYESAEAIKAEAVKVATSLGKPDPERSVEQSIVSRLPHRRAFKETPNAAQMARVMAKMSSSERAQVTQLNNTLKIGLDRMGIKTDFVDQPRLTDAPRSRLAGGGLRLDRPRRGRRSRLIGLSNRRSRTSSRLRSRTRRRRRLSALA